MLGQKKGTENFIVCSWLWFMYIGYKLSKKQQKTIIDLRLELLDRSNGKILHKVNNHFICAHHNCSIWNLTYENI